MMFVKMEYTSSIPKSCSEETVLKYQNISIPLELKIFEISSIQY